MVSMPVRVLRLVPPTLQSASRESSKDFVFMICDADEVVHLCIDVQRDRARLARLHRVATQVYLRSPSKM